MEGKRRYLLKGDLSGIQNFIFNVKSKGAAKELKKRSLYVSQLSDKLLEEDEKYFEKDNLKRIYNGGGNFFYEITTDKDEGSLKAYFEKKNENYITNDIFPFYAFSAYENGFQNAMKDVNKAMLLQKQQRAVAIDSFDEPRKSLPENLNGEGINYHTPRDSKGEILDFDHLAERGKGDNKLAALKMDVDHLGQLFQNQTEENYKYLSRTLKNFFDEKLLKLIQEKNIGDQVYVVFSGGDDCFIIGCWHTILELAMEIRKSFSELSDQIKKEGGTCRDLTFSAGITIFPPKYPLKQLAEEVEDFLNQAKKEGRNRVTIFGHSLRWEDYQKVLEIKEQLYHLVVEKNESKSLIQRVKSSDIGYASLQKRAQRGVLEMPKVWSLKYYLRNVNKNNKEEVEELFNAYSNSLIEEFMNKKAATNPMVFPIAARLTELLIKN